ncbi:MAG: tripartite tricarboxylate transporter substrate binding protein [Acetobacteraceae bacterium]|nr:tripartite tricarboxylate transporter substrate binding protein [Acetobacteraceae bacterium]
MRRRTLLAALPAALALPRATRAQGFERTIRVVIPFAPGGTSDIIARLIAPELTRLLGQSVVVENRTGGFGNIAIDHVAKAPPDGHTMLLSDVGILATAPSLFTRLPFDVMRDLAPVTMLIYAPYILAVNPGVAARDAAALQALAKASPDRINVAHSGIGSANHLTALLLAQHWGVQLTMVPYRGGAAAVTAVAGGEAQMVINGATATQPFVTGGQLRGIAVTGAKRLMALPEVPTFAELGWPAPDNGTWQGVLVPAGSPPALVARLDGALRAALAVPAVAERLASIGGEIRAEGAAPFREWLVRETAAWGGVIRANGIRLD